MNTAFIVEILRGSLFGCFLFLGLYLFGKVVYDWTVRREMKKYGEKRLRKKKHVRV